MCIRDRPTDAPAWRLPALVGLQVVAAALLWLTLNPPAAVMSGISLRVLTGGDLEQTAAPGEILVALPEARARGRHTRPRPGDGPAAIPGGSVRPGVG